MIHVSSVSFLFVLVPLSMGTDPGGFMRVRIFTCVYFKMYCTAYRIYIYTYIVYYDVKVFNMGGCQNVGSWIGR